MTVLLMFSLGLLVVGLAWGALKQLKDGSMKAGLILLALTGFSLLLLEYVSHLR